MYQLSQQINLRPMLGAKYMQVFYIFIHTSINTAFCQLYFQVFCQFYLQLSGAITQNPSGGSSSISWMFLNLLFSRKTLFALLAYQHAVLFRHSALK